MILIITAVLVALAAFFNSIMDIVINPVKFKNSVFKNSTWWDFSNQDYKYNNDGSKRGFIITWFGDGWHCMKFFMLACYFLAICICIFNPTLTEYSFGRFAFSVCALAGIHGIVFETFYNLIWIR